MANENAGWGYTKLRGAMWNLGHDLGRTTIKRILEEHGITPAPERGSRMPWKTFLKAHWQALAAADFFNVEVLTRGGLVRYWVFFVMELSTRKVEIAGITCQPCDAWMRQTARNLTDELDGFLIGKRYIIMDRDPLYTAAFRGILKQSGVKPVPLPPRSPDLNAYAERFVLSIKSECLNKLVLLGERHLRQAVDQYVRHYYTERNHQGLGNQLIEPLETPGKTSGPVHCRQRLGGLLNYYYREAA
jgi:transposase InsO family protein